MIGALINNIWYAIDSGFSFLNTLYLPFGLSFVEIAMGMAIIAALFKFVLSPYLSGSGSDSAKNSKKKGG